MPKIIGFLIESAAKAPVQHIIKTALKQRVYIINETDKALCQIHKNVTAQLKEDQWNQTKYDVLDNLCYFLDERRAQHCDLVIKVGENQDLDKIDELLSQQI